MSVELHLFENDLEEGTYWLKMENHQVQEDTHFLKQPYIRAEPRFAIKMSKMSLKVAMKLQSILEFSAQM